MFVTFVTQTIMVMGSVVAVALKNHFSELELLVKIN
jgi:hypothetical protein